MIHRLITYLYKPGYLVLNPNGCIHLDHDFTVNNIFNHPDELHQFFDDNVIDKKVIRVVIDTFDHRWRKITLPKHAFWQHHKLIQQHIKSQFTPDDANNHILFCHNDAHNIYLTTIFVDDKLTAWFKAINLCQFTVLSVESFVYGLSRIAPAPQLYILANQFNRLRFVFVTPQSDVFSRFLSYDSGPLPLFEVQRTIHYISREFHVMTDQINIISSLPCSQLSAYAKTWQDLAVTAVHSERYLLSLLTMAGGHHYAKSVPHLKMNRWNFFRKKLIQPLVFLTAIIMTIANSINHHYDRLIEGKINTVLKHNRLLQQQFDDQQFDQRMQNYQRLQILNKPYLDAGLHVINPVKLIYRLSQLQHTNIKLSHLVYIKSYKQPVTARLLLEGVLVNNQGENFSADHVLQTYSNSLKSCFKDATVITDYSPSVSSKIPANFDTMSADMESSIPPTVVIQIDRIKL